MKFQVRDTVRVIAWAVPGTSTLVNVCGARGSVVQNRQNDPNAGSDGVYKVDLPGIGVFWFRACDLVAADSECTCDNTMRKIPVGECLVHDRPDPDPTAEAAARLVGLVHEMEEDLR